VQDALVLSAAANGYARVYRGFLATHRDYARRCDLAHALVLPRRPLPRTDAAWLKIALLRRALERHQWVLWVDADAQVMPGCPDFRGVEEPGGLLYLAEGHTGRLNSGVIAARAHPDLLAWLDLLLDRADEPVPAQDAAPYENGHVIHYARDLPFLRRLERRWNNMVALEDGDHIRHFTGPLARRRPSSRAAAAISRGAELVASARPGRDRAPTGARARGLARRLYP
jgi:hypothetical protein